MTSKWRITNANSGLELGVYEGADQADALDTMARDAGYRDYADACEVAPLEQGELLVELVDEERPPP